MLILPLIVITIFSFGERAPAGGYIPSFTFDQYLNLSARFVAFKNTLTLAPIGTIIALIIGYPLAYFLVFKVADNKKNILLVPQKNHKQVLTPKHKAKIKAYSQLVSLILLVQ